MNKFTDNFIEINGFNTRYWELGEGDNVILFLHGFAFSIELWNNNLEAFAKKNFRVLAIDILGFGLTERPKKKQKLDALPLFVKSFLDEMKINQVILVGHSMGGLIATKLSQMFPEKVKSLVLVGCAGFKKEIPIHFRIFSLPFFGEFMIKPNKRGLESALRYNTFIKKSITKEFVDTLYHYSQFPYTGKTLLRINRTAVNFFGFKKNIIEGIKSEAEKLKMPVLIIWGFNDNIIYVSHAYAVQEMIPHSKLDIFENCGHLPQLEYPEKFNETVLNFVQSI